MRVDVDAGRTRGGNPVQSPRGTEACDWGRGHASHRAGGALRGAAAASAAAPPQALAAAAAATPLS